MSQPLRADPAGCGSAGSGLPDLFFFSISLYSWSFPFTWALRVQPWISTQTTDSQCRSAACFITAGTLVTAQTFIKTPGKVLMWQKTVGFDAVTQTWASARPCARVCGGPSILCCSSFLCRCWCGSERSRARWWNRSRFPTPRYRLSSKETAWRTSCGRWYPIPLRRNRQRKNAPRSRPCCVSAPIRNKLCVWWLGFTSRERHVNVAWCTCGFLKKKKDVSSGRMCWGRLLYFERQVKFYCSNNTLDASIDTVVAL